MTNNSISLRGAPQYQLKLNDYKFNTSVMDLVKMGLAKDGYLENIGWKHSAIVELANDFGLELQYAKRFFYTP